MDAGVRRAACVVPLRDGLTGGVQRLSGAAPRSYRLWHPLVVLNTLRLIKRTSNARADFLPARFGRCVREGRARAGERARAMRVFAEESVIDVLFI